MMSPNYKGNNNIYQGGQDQNHSNMRVNKGPQTMSNGAIYTGEWSNGMRDGHGNQLWPDGSRYEGQWYQDKASGKGRL